MTEKPGRGDAAPVRPLSLWGPLSRFGLAIAAAVFAVDQAHKYWMISFYDIAARGRVEVTPFLDLIYVLNPGISYSLFELQGGTGQAVLAAFACLVSLGIAYWLARTGSRIAAVSLGLVMGGALGNALDRVTLGGVADFFSLHAYGFYWYVFNLADVAIVVGVAGLLYESLLGSRKAAANGS